MPEPLHILLVADDPEEARLVEEHLRAAPSLATTVKRVGRLDAAAAPLKRGHVNLVLLDIPPSDTHAVETVSRAIAAAPELPVVVLTGVENEVQGVQAMKAGAEDYLVKEHLTPALLTRSIRYSIERKQLEVERRRLLSTSAEMNERLIVTSLREQEARGVAETAVRARDQVLHVFSHDVANQLAAIQIYADKLLGALPAEPSRPRDCGTAIKHLAADLQELRKSILDAARIDAGLTLSLRMEQPRVLLDLVRETLMPLAIEKGVALDVTPGPVLPGVYADRTRMLEALGNVVANAIKFTPRGGTISLRGVAIGREVHVAVADTGSGIAPDDLPLVFESFWKKRAANPEGIGLGLTIARGIVERHGGRIHVESQLGRGTVVTLSLPVAETGAPPKPSSGSAAGGPLSQGGIW